jgi:uncharacterized protein (DUF2267 family)
MNRDDFLARVQKAGGLAGRNEAERWSTEVLRALTHLLSEAEIRRHFVSQLPGFLKSRLRDEPPHVLLMDREAFLQHVASALGTHVPGATRAVRVVYDVLKEALSAGQIAEFEGRVPKEIARFLEHAP